jgi:hypothetical protein
MVATKETKHPDIFTLNLRALRVLLCLKICAGRVNFPTWETSRSRIILPRRRKDAKFREEFIFFKNFAPSRLCERYSDIWRRLCHAGSFVVQIYLLDVTI